MVAEHRHNPLCTTSDSEKDKRCTLMCTCCVLPRMAAVPCCDTYAMQVELVVCGQSGVGPLLLSLEETSGNGEWTQKCFSSASHILLRYITTRISRAALSSTSHSQPAAYARCRWPMLRDDDQ